MDKNYSRWYAGGGNNSRPNNSAWMSTGRVSAGIGIGIRIRVGRDKDTDRDRDRDTDRVANVLVVVLNLVRFMVLEATVQYVQ